MTSCDGICDFQPFKSSVTPEGSDVEILRQEIEDYILRLRDQICADIRCLEDLIAALDVRITALETP